MRFRILALALLLLSTASIGLAASASASPARPTIARAAQELHDAELDGGSADLFACHRGAQPGTTVCSVSMTGIAASPDGPAEAECQTAIAAVWRPILVPGAKVVGSPGLWSPRQVADMRCEGSPL